MCHREMSHPFFFLNFSFFFYTSPVSNLNIHQLFSLLYLERVFFPRTYD